MDATELDSQTFGMTLHLTDRSITSDITPEAAYHLPDHGDGRWMLTWLPGRILTREQAIQGMRLDELLSDPRVDGEAVLRSAAIQAAALGLDPTDVVVRLATRIADRDRRRADPPVRRRHCGASRARSPVPQRFMLSCLALSTLLGRALYAVATLPSLAFVVAALLTARLTGNGWAVTGVTVAASAVTCTLTLAGGR